MTGAPAGPVAAGGDVATGWRATAARGVLALVGAASVAGYALDLHARFGSDLSVLSAYVGLFGVLFAGYLVATLAVLGWAPHDRGTVVLVLGFALAFRVAALTGPVVTSSDVFRYLWDGRVQVRGGMSPYRHPPSAPELAGLRDAAIHPAINRPDKPTVYPPGAQALFALAAVVAPDSLVGWRLLLLAGDAATAVLLLAVLRRAGVPPGSVVVWAWAPLAVFETAQAGHVDGAVPPLVLLALRWRQERRLARAGAALGAAVLIKLYPAVLLVAWWRRGDRRLPLACAAVAAAGYLAYAWPVGRHVLGFLPEYLGPAEDFNVGLRHFLTEAIGLHGAGARALAMVALGGALLVALLVIAARREETPSGVLRAGAAAAAAYLVLAPTPMHPWYAVWILPFVAARPSAAWLWFTGAVSLSYLAYVVKPAPFPLWLRIVQYVPLWALLLRAVHGRRAATAVAPAGAACAGLPRG